MLAGIDMVMSEKFIKPLGGNTIERHGPMNPVTKVVVIFHGGGSFDRQKIFALRGFKIANNSPDLFSRLLVSGIVILITVQSFMHIASVTGVFPLTGVPLPFMSHGGTSLAIYLMAMGIVLQVSKFQRHESR